LAVDEFLPERLQGLVVEVKVHFERPIRHTLALAEEVYHLIEEGVKIHWAASLGPLPDQSADTVCFTAASMYHSGGRKERGRCGEGGLEVWIRCAMHHRNSWGLHT
jgi:hypothetical protein